jgi:hypothetical protein
MWTAWAAAAGMAMSVGATRTATHGAVKPAKAIKAASAAKAVKAAAIGAMTPAELDAFVQKLHAVPSESDRVALASEKFLGTRYVLGPLGEGQGQDPDPLIRYDAVDCVTFVEEVLALTRAESGDKVCDTLQQIRYRGDQISYAERNHFVEAAWLPNNVKKGYLKEITREVAGADVLESKRTFTLEDWKHRSDAKEIVLPDALAPVGEFDLNILPLDKVVAHQDQLPNGAVMIMVRSWGPLTSNRIGHLGLIVRKGDAVFVRHASSLKHEVIDVPIADFVENCKAMGKKWPVVGLSFAAPQG